MKALVLREPFKISIEDCLIPDIDDSDVLVKVLACGICGTDVHILRGEHIVKFPVIPGHEFSGEIVEIGSKVANVAVGDLVTVDPNIVDRTCFFCRRGEIHLCENLSATGVNYDGGFAEFCRVPAVQAYKIPSGVSPEEAAMVEPLACCLHGIVRVGAIMGRSVVLLGAGSIGLLMLQLLKTSGALPIIVSEPDARKSQLAVRFGADVVVDPGTDDLTALVSDITKVGADIVIDCAGTLATSEIAIKLARRGGTVMQFGVVSPDKVAKISPYDVYYKELTVLGSFVNPFTHSRAIDLIASHRVDINPLITHRFALSDAENAMTMAQSGDAVKIMIVP
ncbi:MAG: zinc-dependent alcohol dehydrogenase family protein [Armatimonadota bacterium]